MRQPGHEKHEAHALAALRVMQRFPRDETPEEKTARMAEAQVRATLAVYHALIMQRAGRGPSVSEMASDF